MAKAYAPQRDCLKEKKNKKQQLKSSKFCHSPKFFTSTYFLPLLTHFINFTVVSLIMPSICHYHYYHKLCGYKYGKTEIVKYVRDPDWKMKQSNRNSYYLTEICSLCMRLKTQTKSYFFTSFFVYFLLGMKTTSQSNYSPQF